MFEEVKNRFLAHLRGQQKAPATIVAYGKDIEQLIATLSTMGKTSFSDLSKEDLESFLLELKKKNFTPKTISRKINSIKTLYRFLQSEHIVEHNPAAELSHPKYELKEPRILSKLEYRALRDVCRSDTRIYAIIELFLQTGLRISEVADLRLEQVKDDCLEIGSRRIPLNQSAMEAIKAYLAIRPNKGSNSHVFITKTGNPLLVRNIRTVIDRALKTAGIENAKVNDLRVTFIAHQLAAGAPLEYISKLVGHKRISTTERYLNLVQEKPKKGAKLTEL
ncbi:tyrosine-type recombinase/integrase, partial [Candidatus Roizmanbacteria bacterium]|nr:tyrosine-type recombinase/integrase [Candidatus Roizmanbacteria bacterium]